VNEAAIFGVVRTCNISNISDESGQVNRTGFKQNDERDYWSYVEKFHI
jgi:hypothetical protein